MEGEETENISKFEEIKNELLKAKSTDEKVQILEQLASAISDISGNDIFITIFIIIKIISDLLTYKIIFMTYLIIDHKIKKRLKLHS